MDIILDGNKLNYELENENTVLQVVEGIENWLSTNSGLIEEIIIDGELIFPTDKQNLKTRLISQTKKVEIKVSNKEEYAINSLFEMNTYINNILDELSNQDSFNQKSREELIDGLKWTNEMILTVCRTLLIDMNLVFIDDKPLSDITAQNNILLVELDTNKHNPPIFLELIQNKIIDNIKSIKSFIPKIIQKAVFHHSSTQNLESDNIIKNLDDIILTIGAFLPIIPNIGTYLQTGKELEAYVNIKNILGMMENLVYNLSHLEKLIQVNYTELIIDEMSVNEANKKFNDLLNELSDAFTKNDIVLLGDLLEYELIGQLEKYQRIFKELIVIVKKKNYN